MSESKSSTVSLDVFSCRMKNCNTVYPLKIIKPLVKNVIDNKQQLSYLLDDITENNVEISQLVADNLKRAVCKDVLNHASTYPCEYCFSKGVRFQNDTGSKAKKHFGNIRESLTRSSQNDEENVSQIEKDIDDAEKEIVKCRSHIVWPASTSDGEPRTKDKILNIVEKIESEGKLHPDIAKGVVGRSPLLSLPNFDIVMDSPTEYLHSVCLGVTKRLVELTFQVGDNRPRIVTRKLSNPVHFNQLMLKIKVVREFSRRIREMDFAVMKGQEFRNLVLFFFPVILSCIPQPSQERTVWLYFVFIIRACVLPIKEFKLIQISDIEKTAKAFYELYEKLYGPRNCTYNTHIVGAHIVEMRYHGPLTETSAYRFESFYGEIRNAFTPGTQSTLKQIFKHILIKRILTKHSCEIPIHYSDHETALENDTLVYCFENYTHKMYKICEVLDDSLICLKQGRYETSFKEIPNLNCAQIGIYKKGPLGNDKITIDKKTIDGKVLSVENYFITCPNNVLREK